MADRARIVSIDQAGTVTTVKDLQDITNYYMLRDSFAVHPPARNPVLAQRTRRYAGARTVAESHGNGEIVWSLRTKGASGDAALLNLESALTVLEAARTDLFFEWRPEGASNSVYYEIRGPAQWSPVYSNRQFVGATAIGADITIPVGPLAWGTKYTIAISSTALPAVVQLSSAITGDAPALADVALRTSGGTSPPIWALLGWAKRPGTPLAGSVAPFGVIEAESATTVSTWAVAADASKRGGSGLNVNTSGAGGANATWAVDPSVLDPDDFRLGEVDVEVWARVLVASTVVSPALALSLEPDAGTNFGQPVYSAEYGSVGKQIVKPSSSTVFRMVKLGTLTMPVDVVSPLKWRVKVAGGWAAGSSGAFSLDYLVMVPARARALSPSGKPNDSSYPDFIVSTADTTKLIRSDLSGRVGSAAGNTGRDAGLGGSLIELPVGNVDMLLKLSSLVPDDPTLDATSEQLSHTVTGTVTVTPRYWVGRGA